jgi:hypothetical protein
MPSFFYFGSKTPFKIGHYLLLCKYKEYYVEF